MATELHFPGSVSRLAHRRIAIVTTDGFESLELIEPLRALRSEGAHTDIVASHPGTLQGMHQHHKTIRIQADRVLGDTVGETVLASQYDALVLPGGAICADALRTNPAVQRFVLAMMDDEKIVASISHAAWVLISANAIIGRKVTGFQTLEDDLRNAGALWVDAPVVIDDNLISTRGIKDLAAFNVALVDELAREVPMISPGSRHILARSRFA